MTNTTTSTGPAEGGDATASTTTPATSTTTEPTTVDGLPDFAKKLISDARGEAAKYRTERNAAVEAAKLEAVEAHKAELDKVAAEKAAAAETAAQTVLELTKLRAALSVGVPSEQAAEFADLLKGTTEDELKAHAEKVKGLFGAAKGADSALDPTQGVSGSAKPDPGPGLKRLRAAYGTD